MEHTAVCALILQSPGFMDFLIFSSKNFRKISPRSVLAKFLYSKMGGWVRCGQLCQKRDLSITYSKLNQTFNITESPLILSNIHQKNPEKVPHFREKANFLSTATVRTVRTVRTFGRTVRTFGRTYPSFRKYNFACISPILMILVSFNSSRWVHSKYIWNSEIRPENNFSKNFTKSKTLNFPQRLWTRINL